MNKTRWFGYVLLALVAYLVFLVATVPASWLAWGLTHFTRGTVTIDQSRGTAWRGTGRLIVYYPRSTPRDLGQAEWRVNPLWLPAARLQLSVTAVGPQSDISGTADLTLGKVVIQDPRVSTAAQFASQLYAPLNLLSPKGQFRFLAERLTLDRSGLHGNAQLFWDKAGSGLSSVQPLGDYRLDLNGNGESVALKLSTLRGALELGGQGRWRVLETGDLQFGGFASPTTHARELEPLLGFFGRSERGGRRSFRLRMRLALPVLRSNKRGGS